MRGAQGECLDLTQVHRHPEFRLVVSTPIDTPALSRDPSLPLARSLRANNIRAEGASALAAVLKETKISNLKCAAALCVRFCVSAR